MIKILIVEDSPTTAEYVKFILQSAGGFEVISIAVDGEQAVAAVARKKPDIVLMDINMPGINGFEATRAIMETNPVPIVIFSASWDPEDVHQTFLAMEAGALAVLEKPSGPGSPGAERMVTELVQTLRLMSEVPVVKRRGKQREGAAGREDQARIHPAKTFQRVELVAVGASTGGPPVLNTILSNLPGDFTLPILIVQHISAGFLSGLATWLDRSCDLTVKVARHRDRVEAGHVYLAPDNLHMGVTGSGTIALSDTAPQHNIRPAVSYLFRSVALEYHKKAAGILLTGMGKDGAEELGLIKEGGGVTIAQDEGSSVVHGMPGEAIKLGNAAYIQTPEEIVVTLKQLEGKK
jgi:two-component system, chemotaxis family, protein-glutamate methylesterase/glutaminase